MHGCGVPSDNGSDVSANSIPTYADVGLKLSIQRPLAVFPVETKQFYRPRRRRNTRAKYFHELYTASGHPWEPERKMEVSSTMTLNVPPIRCTVPRLFFTQWNFTLDVLCRFENFEENSDNFPTVQTVWFIRGGGDPSNDRQSSSKNKWKSSTRVSIASANLYLDEERVAFMFFTFDIRGSCYVIPFSLWTFSRSTRRCYLETVKLNI